MPKSKLTYPEWLDIADEYYLAARSLEWFAGLAYPAVHAGHHALELYLKSRFVEFDGSYPKGHDLSALYNQLILLNTALTSDELKLAVDSFLNYDQTGRYTSEHATSAPGSNSIGTGMIEILDNAVVKIRDLSVETFNGIDHLMKPSLETPYEFFRKGEISRKSVILFHMNNAFIPKNDDFGKYVNYSAPTYPLTIEDVHTFAELERLSELPDDEWINGLTSIPLFPQTIEENPT